MATFSRPLLRVSLLVSLRVSLLVSLLVRFECKVVEIGEITNLLEKLVVPGFYEVRLASSM